MPDLGCVRRLAAAVDYTMRQSYIKRPKRLPGSAGGRSRSVAVITFAPSVVRSVELGRSSSQSPATDPVAVPAARADATAVPQLPYEGQNGSSDGAHAQ